MIKFEITESPDHEVVGVFEYFHNMIYIGRSSGNLTIQDQSIMPSHLLIEVVEKDAIIHPQKDVDHYLINGKRATTPRKIKLNDVIQFGTTKLKLLAFGETHFLSKKDCLNEKLDQLIASSSGRVNVIESLAKLAK